jgi:hypothetical protein
MKISIEFSFHFISYFFFIHENLIKTFSADALYFAHIFPTDYYAENHTANVGKVFPYSSKIFLINSAVITPVGA